MEVELPPRYEEILIEPLQLSVVELGRDTISEVHTAERPIAQVVSSIPPVVETDSATSISGNESDNPQTRSNVNSGSFANSAFEIP